MAEPKIAVFDIFCGYGGTSVGFREVIWNQGFPGTFEFVGSLNDQVKRIAMPCLCCLPRWSAKSSFGWRERNAEWHNYGD